MYRLFVPTRRKIIIVTPVVGVLVLSVVLLVVLRFDIKLVQIGALAKEEQAIKRAQEHLAKVVSQIDPAERLVLAYLQRKFSLNAKLGLQGSAINLDEDTQTYPEEKHYLARIAFPNKLVKQPPKLGSDDRIQFTNIYSANCDHMQLPVNFWPTMEQSFQDGGYHMTHVALAFAFMADNNCMLPSEADSLKRRTMHAMAALAGDPTTVADLRYEAVALLMLSQQQGLVQRQWIDQIVSEQRGSGAWGREVGDDSDDIHSTILALWALLEYYRPDVPTEPLINRPGLSS